MTYEEPLYGISGRVNRYTSVLSCRQKLIVRKTGAVHRLLTGVFVSQVRSRLTDYSFTLRTVLSVI